MSEQTLVQLLNLEADEHEKFYPSDKAHIEMLRGAAARITKLEAVAENLPILVYVCTVEGRELVARLASAKDLPPFDVSYNQQMTWEMDSTRSEAEATTNEGAES